MLILDRKLLLNTLIKHETLTLPDIGKPENLGLRPDEQLLQSLLDQLEQESCIQKLNGAMPCTYTVTDKGIEEGKRLKAIVS